MGKRFACLLILFLFFFQSYDLKAEDCNRIKSICGKYIETWKRFYPSLAFSKGIFSSIFYFEDFSEQKIEVWLAFNKKTLAGILKFGPDLALEDRIDVRLLKIKVNSEIDKWEMEVPHKVSLWLYASHISRAVSGILTTRLLTTGEKYRLIEKRLTAVNKLCSAAIHSLKDESPENLERSLKSLEDSVLYYQKNLPEKLRTWITPGNLGEFAHKCGDTASLIRDLTAHVRNKIKPQITGSDSDVLGPTQFARKLKLYTDSDLTPQQLEAMALKEIQEVRRLMAETATEYLKETYPGVKVPVKFDLLLNKALSDMEKLHTSSGQEYLRFWKKLARQAEEFIRKNKIATLPENSTLSIKLAPESFGPMARIGWVSPAPPFHPTPWTTLYLPSIPDSFPEKEKKEFWRSFNIPFNTMIVIHELFPGHYIQGKINRENPHPVRILFPYGLYEEGWATLCEKVALESGWDDNNKLTKLAHLRKRLENANRAYSSVQAHCNHWDKNRIMEFSVNTSLLAPQFAKSLWGRLIRFPMQMTSYFLGSAQFYEIYENEKRRCGEKFRKLDFMDTILRAGPIPIDEFPKIFHEVYAFTSDLSG
jgi:hypothetical protein